MKKRTITLVFALIMAVSLAVPADEVDLSSMGKNEKDSSCNIEIQLETNPDILQLNDGSNTNSLALEESEDNFASQENLEKATCAYNSMMNAFYENQPDSKKIYSEDCYTVNGISAEEFPDSFAGAYINSNSDLVVLVPENKTENINDLSSAQSEILKAANSEDIIFASAKYSYRELVSLMDDIYQYLKSGRNGTDGFQIVDFSIDDFNNCVCVGLASNTSESQTAFNQVIKSSDAIIFKYSDPEGFELTGSSALYPGSAISYGSAGYRVKN